jgi:hypothetical protein
VMSADGADARRLAFGPEQTFADAQFAPNGRLVAYQKQLFIATGHFRYSLEVRDLGSARHAILLEQDTPLGSLCWVSDADLIYFGEANAIYDVTLDPKTGRRLGHRVRADRWRELGATDGSFSRSRNGQRFVFNRLTSRRDVYIGDLNALGSCSTCAD